MRIPSTVAAINRFSFLLVYHPALGVQALALALSNSIGTFVWVLFITQATTLLVMTLYLVGQAGKHQMFRTLEDPS